MFMPPQKLLRSLMLQEHRGNTLFLWIIPLLVGGVVPIAVRWIRRVGVDDLAGVRLGIKPWSSVRLPSCGA